MKDSWNGWGEEGGGPYLCVRGPNSLVQTAAQPFHCIDPNHSLDEVVELLARYLETFRAPARHVQPTRGVPSPTARKRG